MAHNYIVLRKSPDWPSFDIQDTRAFLRKIGMDEDMIIRFADRWNADLSISFLEYRQAMKEISHSTMVAVRNADVVNHYDLEKIDIKDEDLLFFSDDDDWVSENLFDILRGLGSSQDGFLWRSIFVGKFFNKNRDEKTDRKFVERRLDSSVVFTNNYAVTGSAWNRLGEEKLLEHYDAQVELNNGGFSPSRIPDYLTAANKHLCCTVVIDYHSRDHDVLENLRGAVTTVSAEINNVQLSDDLRWTAEPLRAFAAINRLALGQD